MLEGDASEREEAQVGHILRNAKKHLRTIHSKTGAPLVLAAVVVAAVVVVELS